MAAEVLKVDIALGRQSLVYKETVNLNGNIVRIRIKSDSYEFQCFAKVEVFNDLKWNAVDHIPYGNMKTKRCLYTRFNRNQKPDASSAALFRADRNELLKRAKNILTLTEGV